MPKHTPATQYIVGPGQPIVLARAALSDAHYHLLALADLVRDPSLGPPTANADPIPHKQANIRFHAHLRGFFWELVSAFDLLPLHLNDIFNLAVDQKDRKPVSRFLKALVVAAALHGRGTSSMKILTDAYDEEWCFEVFEYRHSAHRLFVPAEGLFSADGQQPPWLVLFPARVGQQQKEFLRHLQDYWETMRRLVEQIAAQAGPPQSPPAPSPMK